MAARCTLKGVSPQTHKPCRHLVHKQHCCVQPRRRQRYQLAASAGTPPGPSDSTLLKQRLLQAVSRYNNPQPGDSVLDLEVAVEAAAEQLAAANPTPDAATSPLLQGSWALLFSGRSRRLVCTCFAGGQAAVSAGGSLRQAVQAASDAAYSSFYRYVPLLAGSAVGRRSGGASNVQTLLDNRVDNTVRTEQLLLCVSGSTKPVSPRPGAPVSCVAVTFDRFFVQAGGLPRAELSLSWLRPLGYVDTCYLDGSLRVSVGDKGGLFVLQKLKAAE